MAPSKASYGVAFSGGGALGSWEVGCLRAIRRKHGQNAPRVAVGTSVGALNAAAVCAGMPQKDLEALWLALRRREVFRLPLSTVAWALAAPPVVAAQAVRHWNLVDGIASWANLKRSAFDNSPLRDTLHRHLSGRWQAFHDSDIRFAAVTTDLAGEEIRVAFKGPLPQHLEGATNWYPLTDFDSLLGALMSSSAIPLAFPGQHGHVDGGVARNSPVGTARHFWYDLRSEAGEFPIYLLIPQALEASETDGLGRLMGALVGYWMRGDLRQQLSSIKTIDRAQGVLTPICIVRPRASLRDRFGVSTLTFRKRVSDLFDDGEAAAEACLQDFHRSDESGRLTNI